MSPAETTAPARWGEGGAGGGPRVPGDGHGGNGWHDGNGHGGDGRASPTPPNARFAVVLMMIASTMLFAALVGGMIVLRAGVEEWPPPDAPPLWPRLRLGTLLILASSVTLVTGHLRLTRGSLKGARAGLLVTLLLGGGFVAAQVTAWHTLGQQGFLPSTHNFGGMFYLLTLLHGLHVVGAMLLLLAATVRTLRAEAAGECRTLVGVAGTFWHFLAVTWLVLLVVLV